MAQVNLLKERACFVAPNLQRERQVRAWDSVPPCLGAIDSALCCSWGRKRPGISRATSCQTGAASAWAAHASQLQRPCSRLPWCLATVPACQTSHSQQYR